MSEERRSAQRTLPEVSPELQDAIDVLPPEHQEAFTLFWRNLAGYAHYNAGLLNSIKTLARRSLIGIAVVLAVLLAIEIATGIVTIDLSVDHHDETKQQITQSEKSVQTSRYDGAYRSCSATDMRNARAVQTIQQHAPAGAMAFSMTLLNEAVPQRGTPDLKHPNILTASQNKACVHYAKRQTALHVPGTLEPPTKPPTS